MRSRKVRRQLLQGVQWAGFVVRYVECVYDV